MKKVVLFIFALTVLSFASCDDPSEGNLTPPVEEYPVTVWLEQNSDDFSEWLALLKRADLDKTMNLNTTYTVFVPENQAVTAYLSEHGYASVSDMPKDEAVLLAKYHTIHGSAYTQTNFEGGVLADTTATGDLLSVDFINSVLYVNEEARVTRVDQKLSNGMLHAIDKVLVPVTATAWDIVNTPEYSVMAQVFELTGLAQQINTIRVINTVGTSVRVYYSVFAVPDAVYEASGIHSADELIDALGARESDPAQYAQNSNALYKYAAYHLLTPQYTLAQLFSSESTEISKNIATYCSGELINVSAHNSVQYVNYNTATGEGITITEADIRAKNGVIHKIDAPMYIVTPDRATVLWELTDYDEISKLTSNYRKSGLTSNTEVALKYSDFKSFKWETAVPENRDAVVKYIVYNKNEARNSFLNYDGLSLQLRLYGWIEMETPTIIRGKYSVKLRHYSTASSAKSGKITMMFGGQFVGAETPTLGYSSSTAQILSTAIGTVEFAETSTHTMRILQTDNSTIYLDYVEFVPAE